MPGKISSINQNMIMPVPSAREKLLSREKRYPGRFGLMQHNRSLSLAADPLYQSGTLPGGMRRAQSPVQKPDDDRQDQKALRRGGYGVYYPIKDTKAEPMQVRKHTQPKIFSQDNSHAVFRQRRQSSVVRSMIKTPSAVRPPGYWLTGFTLDPDQLKLGKRFDGGAFGDVYDGTYRGIPVAVKTPKKQLNKDLMAKLDITYQDLIEGIESESTRLSSLNHPNIVGCYGSLRKDGQFYLVMEYCEGGDVKKWLANEDPGIRQKWQVALETAYGLAYLHEQGIVHRDVKQKNVLRDGQGKAKLTDLGLAQADKLLRDQERKNIEEAKEDEVPKMTVSVTGPYAAPEEKKGRPSTEASDMYSYGLLLWQLVTGRDPARMSLPDLIGGMPKDCPREMRAIIERCLIGKPGNRLKAGEVVSRLEGIASAVYGEKGIGIQVTQRLSQVLHDQKIELAAYIEPHVSNVEIKESSDSYWQQREKEGKEEKGSLGCLLERIEHFLGTKKRVMMVLGDGGTGKTLSTCALANKWQKQWQKKFREEQAVEERPWLPIMLRPGIDDWSQEGIRDGIVKALGSQAYQLDKKALEVLKTRYRVLFILDGYDELHVDGKRESIDSVLGLADWPHAKLVITTRPGIVEENKEQEIFGINGVYASCYVLPFNIRQMLKYLRRQLEWNIKTEEHYFKKLTSSERLREVLRNPFVLSLMVRSWPKIKNELDKGTVELSQYDIYEVFTRYWLEREANKIAVAVKSELKEDYQDLLSSYEQFAGKAAYQIFNNKAEEELGCWAEIEELVREAAESRYDERIREGRVLISKQDWLNKQVSRLMQFWESAPVRVRGAEIGFMHRTFQEYYMVKYLLYALSTSTLDAQVALFQGWTLDDNQAIVRLIGQSWQGLEQHTREKLKGKLLAIMDAKEEEGNRQAGENAIIILYGTGELTGCIDKLAKADALEQKQVESLGPLLDHAGNYCANVEFDFGLSIKYHETCLALRLKVLGKNHPDLAQSYKNLGCVYYNNGAYERAKGYFADSLEIFLREPDENHLAIATCYDNLGLISMRQGLYQEAVEYHKKSLAIRLDELGENHLDVASCYNNLGLISMRQGHYEEAIAYYEKSLNIKKIKLGKNHTSIAASYNNIGTVYDKKGDYAKAIEYYKLSLGIKLRELEKNNPSVATSYNNLGLVYMRLMRPENFTKAKKYFADSLNIFLNVLDNNHPSIATCYHNLGLVDMRQGNYPAAIGYFEKSLVIYSRSLDNDHPSVAKTSCHLGNVYYELGDNQKAIEYYERAVQIGKIRLGMNHPDTLMFQECLQRAKDKSASSENHPHTKIFKKSLQSVLQMDAKQDGNAQEGREIDGLVAAALEQDNMDAINRLGKSASRRKVNARECCVLL